jgi:hypothetical protein
VRLLQHMVPPLIPLQWNEPSIAFYEKRLGAHPQNEWLGERLEGEEEIARLEAFLQ